MAPTNKELRTLLRTAADEALAAPLPGLAGPGREPDNGPDLSTVERV
jgi:hypothetical protein